MCESEEKPGQSVIHNRPSIILCLLKISSISFNFQETFVSEYILQPSEAEGEEEGDEAVRTRRRRRVSVMLL